MKNYLKDTSNLFSFILGFVPAMIFYVFNPKATVPFWILLLAIFLLCVVIWLLVKSCMTLNELNKHSSSCNIQIIECSHGVCLCKRNNFIMYSSLVMFYKKSGEHEEPIAFGKVETITQNDVAQIKVFSLNGNDDNILTYINNEKPNIIVLPTITTDALQQIANIF